MNRKRKRKSQNSEYTFIEGSGPRLFLRRSNGTTFNAPRKQALEMLDEDPQAELISIPKRTIRKTKTPRYNKGLYS